jgi:hypothetical protein
VADVNFLSSQAFRLAFAETFLEAVGSEVRANAFVTNNPDTFYFNGYVHRYQNFFRADPEESVTLFTGPGFDAGTRPRALPWFRRTPVYFSLDAHAGGVHRDDPQIQTPSLVQRYEIFPRLSVPLRLGPYFGVTPTFGLRAMRYGAREITDPLVPGGLTVVNNPLRRITGEVSVDVRFPSFERIFERKSARYKHVIEPDVTYRYRNGVHDFAEIIRFDERDIITDTNEVEYGITQRIFVKSRGEAAQPRELLRWRIAQKYFINRDFGGALQPGMRNVFQSTLALTPFAFSDQARGFSPITTSIQITPGGPSIPTSGGLHLTGKALNTPGRGLALAGSSDDRHALHPAQHRPVPAALQSALAAGHLWKPLPPRLQRRRRRGLGHPPGLPAQFAGADQLQLGLLRRRLRFPPAGPGHAAQPERIPVRVHRRQRRQLREPPAERAPLLARGLVSLRRWAKADFLWTAIGGCARVFLFLSTGGDRPSSCSLGTH